MFKQLRFRHSHVVSLISLLVLVYGLFIIGSTLVGQFKIHRLHLLSYFSIDVHILFGLGFVYLSLLLLKRKRNALYLATVAFAVLLADGIVEIALHPASHKLNFAITVNYIILPVIITAALILYRNEFKVKSDFQTFMGSIKLAVVVIIITLMYGVSGFLLMDKSDFHQEIGFTSALHHTVDQFDLTTSQPLIAYTKRAQLFLHSLSIISIGSIVFLMISLVQPVKSRLGNDEESRKRINSLMERFGAPSEDFFKLWPRDKHYFFDSSGNAALAYKTKRGVALILADPVGDENSFKQLLREFHDMCWSNDWQPALIHVDAKYKWLYRKSGYQLQLIGQEAFVNVEHFCKQTRNNKYFRNIVNRFGKEGYTFEILNPPHNKAKVNRLRVISDEWLSKPGRTERGFVMGYFSEEYLQKCSLAVVKDSARNIQAFLNIIPSTSFNRKEVTYDMLRAAKSAPPNVNDFLLLSLIDWTDVKGYKTLNMGLSPLIGLDDSQADNGLITSVLRFAYTNGDRFYSFSGLKRFKSKYEPEWVDKMIGFKGGLRGFSKAMNALLPAMSVSSGLKRKSD